MLRKVLIGSAIFLLPVVALAQTGSGLEGLIAKIGRIIEVATPIVFALALLAFFWGLAVYIFNSGNDEKKAQGKNIMIWGIIALFVMVSVFGIIRILRETLGIGANESAQIPRVNVQTGTVR